MSGRLETHGEWNYGCQCPATLRDAQRTVRHRCAQPYLVRADKGMPQVMGSAPRGWQKIYEKDTGR